MRRTRELDRIRDRLLSRYAALRKSLAAELRDLSGQGETRLTDDADVATDTVSDEMASALAERESRELAQIEDALHRMREGRYGRCEICGGRIPLSRLNALPYTSTCIACQRQQEQAHAGTGNRDTGQGWQKVFDQENRLRDFEVDLNDFTFDLAAEVPQ